MVEKKGTKGFKTWREGVVESYSRLLEDTKQSPLPWDDPGRGDATDRLWDSIEALDFVYSDLDPLLRRARERGHLDLALALQRVRADVDHALELLDPQHWPDQGLMSVSVDNVEDLKAARACLHEAFTLFDKHYDDISVDLDAPRRRASWTPWTPVIYRRLRNAAYGVDMFLRTTNM